MQLWQCVCTILLTGTVSSSLAAQQILVSPYLQDASPFSVNVQWETDGAELSRVIWGPTMEFGHTTTTIDIATANSTTIHVAKLLTLQPNTPYYYYAQSDAWTSEVYQFRTPALPAAEQAFQFVAMSDMQKDNGNPSKFEEIVEDGVLPYVDSVYGSPLSDHLSFVLIPGDLVDNGLSWSQWRNDFFAPSANLFSRVPVYPVPGNHENDAAQFFDYFTLPENGTAGYEEHWWTKDYSNVRVFGMDSNNGYRVAAQLNWLDSMLVETCADTSIDFAFVQLHHPHKSELWLPGEIDYTGLVIAKMEQFSTDCSKPSIHFFGHTHGYSRGQSRDHKHLWLNVATAGGNIDYWGEYAQQDYDEFVISQDEYGFVVVEVTAGEAPEFTLKRISLGDEFSAKANTTEDALIVRLLNAQPGIPVPLFPLQRDTVSPECLVLKADAFIDPDGDGHGASHWQISTDSADFSNTVFDAWRQYANWYFDVNTQEGDDLTDIGISALSPSTDYWWRARYRDKGLAWSAWSSPTRFTTGTTAASPNLISNAGAEEGTSAWTVESGALESLLAGECNGISPYMGDKYFAIGALCEEHAFASAYQSIDLTEFATLIDSGEALMDFGAFLADWNGSDQPALAMQFLDESQVVLSETDTFWYMQNSWEYTGHVVSVPVGTRWAKFIMMGTRFAGVDNDSYFDEISVRVKPASDTCDTYVAPGPANNRIYVREDAPGVPTGESWTKAFRELYNALDYVATHPDVETIWMADGTYYTTDDAVRDSAFVLHGNISLYGGFAGHEESVTERDLEQDTTVLSGDIGVPGEVADNAYRVLIVMDVTDTLCLDGVVITSGNGTDGPQPLGAGVYVDTSNTGVVMMINCTVEKCQAQQGAGVYNTRQLQLNACTLRGNQATIAGHSIYNQGVAAVVSLHNTGVTSMCVSCGEEIANSSGAVIILTGSAHIHHE